MTIKALENGGYEWGLKYWPPSKWIEKPDLRFEYIKSGCSMSEELKIIFMGIAKNAGTSIRAGIFKKHIKDFIIHPDLQYDIYSDEYRDYFKFAIVRNPFDRFASNYKYLKKHSRRMEIPDGITFRDFALDYAWDSNGDALNTHWLQQHWFIYDDGGKYWIDFVGRYENLEHDFETVMRKIGLSTTIKLPHLNVSQPDEYREYYDDETKDFIAEKYKKDLELFNYSF